MASSKTGGFSNEPTCGQSFSESTAQSAGTPAPVPESENAANNLFTGAKSGSLPGSAPAVPLPAADEQISLPKPDLGAQRPRNPIKKHPNTGGVG